MNKFFVTFVCRSLAVIFIAAGLPALSHAKINIFACEPEWKALAEEIGGNNIEAVSATTAFQDPHFIRPRPSLLSKVRVADLVICSGAELEIGWLPRLLQKAGSAEVQFGQIGNLMASDYVENLNIPYVLDRERGHIHPMGNPHVHLDPKNLLKVAEELSKRLKKIDPNNSSDYEVNIYNFRSEWQRHIETWENFSAEIEDMKVIVQHGSYLYFNKWMDIQEVADLEPKPGLPPTVAHLEKLLKIVKKERPQLIMLKPFDDKSGAEWLSEKTGIPIVVLPYTVGGNERANDLKSLFDEMINLLRANV